MYEPRTYRYSIRDKDLVSFNVVVKETDLYIRAATNLERKACRLVLKHRSTLEKYIEQHPLFLTSRQPLPIDDKAPRIVKAMLAAATRVGTGPMAAVAGAIAEFVGIELLDFSPELIVENGGDIFIKSLKKRVVGVYAGMSPLTGRIGLEIYGADTPLGVCASSGTVGHSLSYGRADAVIVLSGSVTLADAVATAVGNMIKHAGDIPGGIEFAKGVDGVRGVVIIKGEDVGLWGDVKISQLSRQPEAAL